ncbi:MarR family winged helix-turn-helix transcriptional regulator [Streptomyces sp. NPDC058755]|uniref:MarR family winged helix-turn-helix transcriptional regulator n=1 Tax=Streptomyces sp. NPDC058755 TaxID=3346624 RepID=UPI00368BF738
MPPSAGPRQLDTGTLALFVGHAAALLVQEQLPQQGFGDLRFSHGHVFRHLIDDEPTVGEPAAHLAMNQHGASEAVAELERLGYCEHVPDAADVRIPRVRLTSRSQDAVVAARRARTALDQRLADRLGVAEQYSDANGASAIAGDPGAYVIATCTRSRPRSRCRT